MPSSNVIHWSFDPVALRLGPLSIHWYGILWAAAFLLGEFIARRQLARIGRRDVDVSSLTVYALLGTIIGARLVHCLFYEPAWFLAHPLKILAIWDGGMASHGGALGFVLALALFVPRMAPGLSILRMLDVAAIPIAIGGALVRIANFLNSEILGRATSGQWGVVFENVDRVPRIPIQLFEAMAYLLTALVLWMVQRRSDALFRPGRLSGMMLTLIFGARAVLETWKMPQASYEAAQALSVGQWLSLPFIAVGLWLWWRSGRLTPVPATP